MRIHKCTFANNTGYLGSALAVTSEGAYNTFTSLPTSGHIHLVIQNTKSSFSNHQSPIELEYSPTNTELQFDPCICNSSHVYLHRIINVTFTSHQYRNNNSTGLLAEKSNVFLEGQNVFKNNSGGVAVLFSCTHTYTPG